MATDLEKRLEKIRSITVKYDDLLREDCRELEREFNIPDPEDLARKLAELADDARLLRIGIIGRVKAGKSSLLNSVLFGGRELLPKAPTPMTASLSVITYGESFEAKIEYYSGADIERIAALSSEYDALYREKYAEGLKKYADTPATQAEMAKNYAKNKMREKENETLDAAHDQYERMRASGLLNEFMAGKPDEIAHAANEEEFIRNLGEYVGAGGRKMPFTRSVELSFPLDALRDLAIIDTPGLNDPIPSRSERTNQYLGKCDVVLVVSPAGEFLTGEDSDLMDRLQTREGLNEIYLVASKCDNSLCNNTISEKSSGDFKKALELLKAELSDHALESIRQIVGNNPETDDQFGNLTKKNKSRVVLTSAVCYALGMEYGHPEKWDEEMRHAFGLLEENYPDYFDSSEAAKLNLAALGGIDLMHEMIAHARKKKAEILQKRQAEIMGAYTANLDEYKKELAQRLHEKYNLLANPGQADPAVQLEELKKARGKGGEAVDAAFDDAMDELRFSLRQSIESMRRAEFSDAGERVDNQEYSITKTSHWTTGWWIFKQHHQSSYEVAAVRAGSVRNLLNRLRINLENGLQAELDKKISDWKKNLQANVARALRETVDIDLVDIGTIKRAIRAQVNSLEIPQIDLGGSVFGGNESGVLEGASAEGFMDRARDYMTDLDSRFQDLSRTYIGEIDASVRKFSMGDMLFADIEKRLAELEGLLAAKNTSMARLEECMKELDDVR